MKKLHRCATALLGLFAAAVALAAATAAHAAPPPAEAFFADPDIAEAVLSPSGRQLAIASAKGVTRVGLVIVDLGAGNKITRVAQFSDGDVVDVRWVNDERLIFSVVDEVEGSGKRSSAPGLFGINNDGTKLRQLVRRMGRPVVSNGAGSRLLDWNHRVLRVPAPVPGQPNDEILISQFSTSDDGEQTPLWLDVRTGYTRPVDGKLPAHAVGWLADSRGELRVAHTREKGKSSAFWRAPGSTGWIRLYESKLLDQPFDIEGVDDAGGLYVSHGKGPRGLPLAQPL